MGSSLLHPLFFSRVYTSKQQRSDAGEFVAFWTLAAHHIIRLFGRKHYETSTFTRERMATVNRTLTHDFGCTDMNTRLQHAGDIRNAVSTAVSREGLPTAHVRRKRPKESDYEYIFPLPSYLFGAISRSPPLFSCCG